MKNHDRIKIKESNSTLLFYFFELDGERPAQDIFLSEEAAKLAAEIALSRKLEAAKTVVPEYSSL